MSTYRIGSRRDLVVVALFPVAALLLAAACSDSAPPLSGREAVGATGSRLEADGGVSLDASNDGPVGSDAGDASAPTPTARWVRREGIAPHRIDPGGAALGTRQFIVFGGRIPSPDAPAVLTDTNETLIYRDEYWHVGYAGASPSPRSGSAMVATSAYDIVLFGGASHLADGTTTMLGDTWHFGRYNDYWEKLSPAVAPSPRAHARTVNDPQRNRTILFGGEGPSNADGGASPALRDTWVWNGTTWSALPIAEPNVGASTSLAFDEEQGNVVLATLTRETTSTRLHLLDLTDGGWVERGTGFDVSAYDGRLIFDRSRRALAFVVSGSSSIYVRTATGWLLDRVSTVARVSSTSPAGIFDYDGTFASLPDDNWEAMDGLYGLHAGTTSLVGNVHPGPRSGHGFSNVSSYYVLLFGGMRLYGNNGGALLNDTWEYRDGIWSQWRPAVSPPPRQDPAMAYDDGRIGVYMFGGQYSAPNGAGLYLDDMWFWQAGVWTNIPKSGLWPPARANHGMAYDSVRHRIVLAGGYTNGPLDTTTWEWDGSRWTQSAPSSPYPYSKLTLAFDSKRNQTIAVGEGRPYRAWYDPLKAPVVAHAWDGTRWYALDTLDGAVPLAEPAAAYDYGRNRLVVTSGAFVQDALAFEPVMSTRQEGYELGTAGWTTLASPAPPPRYEAKLAYYGQRNAAVLYGGRDFSARTSFQDTWELVAIPQAQGASCQGTTECASGFCVDGVCCNSDCSYYASDRCTACSVAAGGQIDGVCGPKAIGSVCHPSTTWCSGTGVCSGNAMYPSCEINEHEKDNQSCHGGTCSGGSCIASGDGGVTDGGAPDDGGDAASDAATGAPDGAPPADGSVADASTPDADAPRDGGTDADAAPADASAAADASGNVDAGASPAPAQDEGCACRAAPRPTSSTPAAGLAFAAFAVVVGRRRARRTPRRGGL